MCNSCTPILVGLGFLVLKLLLLSKNGQISLSNHYRPWSSKNLMDWNQLKNFMQVEIDVTCMYTNFGGHSFFGFGDIATFKYSQISLSDHGLYSSWSSKNLINQNWLKKFMQVGVCVMHVHQFGGHDLSSFGDIGLQSMGVKEQNQIESAQKIHASRD